MSALEEGKGELAALRAGCSSLTAVQGNSPSFGARDSAVPCLERQRNNDRGGEEQIGGSSTEQPHFCEGANFPFANAHTVLPETAKKTMKYPTETTPASPRFPPGTKKSFRRLSAARGCQAGAHGAALRAGQGNLGWLGLHAELMGGWAAPRRDFPGLTRACRRLESQELGARSLRQSHLRVARGLLGINGKLCSLKGGIFRLWQPA